MKVSFKERVCEEMRVAAKEYKATYVDYVYLICSEAFKEKEYYIIDANPDNFMHLTGVNSNLSAQIFYKKCIDDTLSENDFNFVKKGYDEKSVKGTVRRKIKALPHMMNMMGSDLQVEEHFEKNRINCSFATTDGDCTVGFYDSGKARPKTLISGNELKESKPVELILRKKSGEQLFDEIVFGDEEMLHKYNNLIKDLVIKDIKKSS